MNETPSSRDWAAARGEKWRDQVHEFEAMLAPVDEPLIEALQLDQPLRIAEIGSGGGGTTLKIFSAAPAGSVVHGYDISPALVEFARRRSPQSDAVAFEVADMSNAPSPARPYDRLVSRFGIMFFDDQLAGFANLVHWLKPGGRFAFAVWGRPEENPWMTTIGQTVAEVIALPAPDPDAPGPFRYGDPGKLLALLDRAGFGNIHVQQWRHPLAMGGGMPAAEAAAFGLAAFGSFAELLAEAGAGALERATQSLTDVFSAHQAEGVVRMDACVNIVTGTRVR